MFRRPPMDPSTILLRFGAAFVLAFALGVVRQRLGKPVGFGTFIFVALGSCGLALTAVNLHPETPLPLLSSIVTGVGFLGAGALFRTADRVVGFTSAATIWICAVFGLTLGVGEYQIASLVYGAIWAVIAVDHLLAQRWVGVHERKLTVELRPGLASEEISALGVPPLSRALSLQFDRDANRLTVEYSIDRPHGDLERFVGGLAAHEGILAVRVE